MTLSMRAAVVREVNQLRIEEVLLDAPHDDEVLVRMMAAGVCHSDLHTLHGQMRAMPPLVLGHEGAGIVEKVGSAVTHVKPGDPVQVNWMPQCDHCPQCRRGRPNLCEKLGETTFQALLFDGTSRLRTPDGVQLKHHLGAATMAQYAVLNKAGILPLPADVPFEIAAVIGCAVATGAGAVINTAEAQVGMSLAVIGCGGVGLSAVMGAAASGCYPVIAVDTLPSKLEFARDLGATHTLLVTPGMDVAAELKRMVRGGPEIVVDSVGRSATIAQSLEAIVPGGTAVVVGLHEVKQPAAINPAALVYQNKRLLGSFFGGCKPTLDLPMLTNLYRAGRLPVDRLITARYTLDDLPRAFEDMEAGTIARGVLQIGEKVG